MKVEKLPLCRRVPFEGPGPLAPGNLKGVTEHGATQGSKATGSLGTNVIRLWSFGLQGIWNPYKAPGSIGSSAIQPHYLNVEPGSAFIETQQNQGVRQILAQSPHVIEFATH
jgi:hypothetical protein